jgi:hypothetical protein
MQLHETNELDARRNGSPKTVWIKDNSSLLSVGLEISLEKSGTRVHRGPEAPQDVAPSEIGRAHV